MSVEYDFSARRFLVVDDEPFMLSLVERMLKQCRAGEIVRATNAPAAFALLRDAAPPIDCVVADCNMPGVNGLQLLQAIRAGQVPNVPRAQPFILLTGHGDESLVKTAIALDVSGYVVKPASFGKLAQTVVHAVTKPVTARDASYYERLAVPRIGIAGEDDPPEPTEPFAWVVMPPTIIHATHREAPKSAAGHAPTPPAQPADGVRSANRRQCALGELREGMVLAEDIYGGQNVLLLKRGTQLSRRLIDRLCDQANKAPPSVWIEDLAG